jgi:predicted phosphodiesterase
MRVAALYDIHGNLPALEAVLREVAESGADTLVVGGDVVPGPQPNETLRMLRDFDLPTLYIGGNGERETLAAARGETLALPETVQRILRWVGEELEPDLRDWIRTWPLTARRAVAGLGDTLFCHATPRSDSAIFTRLTPEERLLEEFAMREATSVVVCGHTHMQFDRVIGGVRVVNAGSVGMPFGEAGAYWLLLGPEVEFRCTVYDFGAAAERIRSCRYPEAEEFATRHVLRPPTEAAMLEILSVASLGVRQG